MPKLRKTRYTLYPIPNVKHENTVYLKLNTPKPWPTPCESISKRWTTLKTEVVGGHSNSSELKQTLWRQKRPLTTIGLN